MDLTFLDTRKSADAGAVMTVKSPANGQPLIDPKTNKPVTIMLIGADAPRFRSAENQRLDKRLRPSEAIGTVVTMESAEKEGRELIALATVGWDGVGLDGKDQLECNYENALAVYTALPWLYEQAAAFVRDRTRFLNVSSGTSSGTPS